MIRFEAEMNSQFPYQLLWAPPGLCIRLVYEGRVYERPPLGPSSRL